MDWDDLRVFLAAGRSDTLTEAAELLGVNQTTVTRRLRSLQDDLRARLFERPATGLAPTQVGEEVLSAAAQIEEILMALERQVLGRDEELRGPLRVTTVAMIAVHHSDLFVSFGQRFPGIDLELAVGDQTRNLTQREADVAIRLSEQPPQHLVGRRLVRVEYALYAAKRLRESLPSCATLADYPWLGWDGSKGARLSEQRMHELAPGSQVACRFDSAVALHAAVRAGMGAAFMPCIYGDEDHELSRLQSVDLGIDMWVLTHPDLRQTVRVKAFIQHVADYVAERRQLFAGTEEL